ncbi:14736_t:CDS:2, partial [Dentiscutata heterogama]
GLKLVDTSIIKARSFTSTIYNSQLIFRKLKDIFKMKNKKLLVSNLDIQPVGILNYPTELEWKSSNKTNTL